MKTRLIATLIVASLAVAGCGGGDDDPAAEPPAQTTADSDTAPGSTPSSDAAGGETEGTPSATGVPAVSNGEPADTSAEPRTFGGALRVGIDAEMRCLLPSACTAAKGPSMTRSFALEPLIRPAPDEEIGYRLILAESVESNDDFTAFTFTLKPGITFSDGTPLTGAVVKDLFDTYVLTEDSNLRGNVPTVESVDATDVAVTFNLTRSEAPFPSTLSGIPIWLPEPDMGAEDIPIGTGPFVFESWTPNVETKLTRNEKYWRTDANGDQLPYLDSVTIVPITSGDTRLNALVSGEVDMAFTEDPINGQQMADQIAVLDQPVLDAGSGLFFNNTGAPTDDVRVRRALAMATDKGEMLAAMGGGEVRTQYFAEGSPFYSDEVAAASPQFDPDGASALLREYIDDPERSDGQPTGTPLTIDIAYIGGAVTMESAALIAQQQWGDLGVTVTLTPKDQATWISDAISGNFNVNFFLWATNGPYNLFRRNYARWPEATTNYTHFNSDELIGFVEEMALAGTRDAYIDLVHQVGMILAEGVPLIFLQSTPVVWGVSDKIEHAEILSDGSSVDWGELSVAAS